MNYLIKNLNILSKSSNLNNFNNIIKLFDSINTIDISKYKINEPKTYEKVIIHKNNYYELVLINWEKGAFTNYHDHPRNGCVLKVLDGKLYEKSENSSKTLIKNSVNFKLDKEYHQIIAIDKSYSLHYYSPPNYYNNNL
jgi:quercetin dioxygenase-like cupin family protein